MSALMWVSSHLLSILAVCVAFGFIIAIHELGHFIMARRAGIRCPRFAIGFGPRLFAFDFRGTEFSICLLPLGGYVMMLGEDPEADETQDEYKTVASYIPDDLLPATRDEVCAYLESRESEFSSDPQAYRHFKSVLGHIRYSPDRRYENNRQLEGNFNDATIPQRMSVILGGVTMNFISALVLFWVIGACYGLVDISPKSLPIAMKVLDNSPAAVAGMAYGDDVIEVAGHKVVSGADMVKCVGEYPAVPVDVKVKRGSKELTLHMVPNALVGNLYFNPGSLEGELPKVVDVAKYGDPYEAGTENIKVGDVLTAIDGQPISSLPQALERFSALAAQTEAAGQSEREVVLSFKDKADARLKLPLYVLKPMGKIGILPAQVTEFNFIEHTTNEVQSVAEGSLAAKLGFQANDIIYFVNGARVADIESLNEILVTTNGQVSPSHPLVFDVARGKEHVVLKSQEGIGDAIGMGLTLQPITMGLVVQKSFSLIGRLIVAPVIIVKQMVDKMISPDLVKASLSGPLGIMQMIFELSDDGVGKLLYIVALINAAVGAFNVLPFPALDGARFFVLLFGFVRGKELDPRKEAMVHQVGLYILLAFVLLVTILDVQRIFAGVPLTK